MVHALMLGLLRVSIFLVGIAGGACASIAAESWFHYEPTPVRLEGTIEALERFDPPNYGENPDTHGKVVVPILRLRQQINVMGDPSNPLNSESEEHVSEVQLVLPPSEDLLLLVGRSVVIDGTLFHSHTGHHATRVLMNVRAVSAVN